MTSTAAASIERQMTLVVVLRDPSFVMVISVLPPKLDGSCAWNVKPFGGYRRLLRCLAPDSPPSIGRHSLACPAAAAPNRCIMTLPSSGSDPAPPHVVAPTLRPWSTASPPIAPPGITAERI